MATTQNEDRITTLFNTFPAALRRKVTAVKDDFLTLAKQYGVIRERSEERARKIIPIYDAMSADQQDRTGKKLNFVDFTRFFDHSVPSHADPKDGIPGYRQHPVYYTLDNMRRAWNKQQTATRQTTQGNGQPKPIRESATFGMAIMAATLLQLAGENAGKLRNLLVTRAAEVFSLSSAGITNFERRLDAAAGHPLVKLSLPRGTTLKIGDMPVIDLHEIQQEAAAKVKSKAGTVTAEGTEAITSDLRERLAASIATDKSKAARKKAAA